MPEITTTHHRQPPPPATTSPPRLSVRGQIGEILELQGGHIARRQSPATSPAPANFPATNFSSSTVKFAPKKEEKPSNNHHRPPASRLGTRGPIGEIVEVHGGHIVRSTGRKDRHSKVCTAKGPRDRRVRLSAHTAIQFYDVQDRLGYDRPSKAVDWLIKNAKSAIDELAKLPPWNPNTVNQNLRQPEAAEEETPIGITERFDEIEVEIENPNRVDFDFLLPSFDSVKSFFPTSAVSGSSTSFNFQNYSAATSGNEDLRLSLQAQTQAHQAHHQTGEELFPAVTTTVGFHGASVFQEDHDRIMPWNNTGGGTINNSDSNNNCHVINSLFSSSSVPPVTTLVALPMYGQSHQCYSSQRGPLQSSISSSNSNCNTSNVLVRAGIDVSTSDHENHYYQQHQYVPPMFNNQALMFGGGGGGSGGGFDLGFRIPARIQGGEEYGGGVSDNMPSSASSESLH